MIVAVALTMLWWATARRDHHASDDDAVGIVIYPSQVQRLRRVAASAKGAALSMRAQQQQPAAMPPAVQLADIDSVGGPGRGPPNPGRGLSAGPHSGPKPICANMSAENPVEIDINIVAAVRSVELEPSSHSMMPRQAIDLDPIHTMHPTKVWSMQTAHLLYDCGDIISVNSSDSVYLAANWEYAGGSGPRESEGEGEGSQHHGNSNSSNSNSNSSKPSSQCDDSFQLEEDKGGGAGGGALHNEAEAPYVAPSCPSWLLQRDNNIPSLHSSDSAYQAADSSSRESADSFAGSSRG